MAGVEAELAAAASGLAAGEPGADQRYAVALERYEAVSAGDFEARLVSACAQVALPPDIAAQPVATLSGGQEAKVALAAILLARYDITLLDEPTNDLDFDGLSRLEDIVARRTGGMVIVSHDRAFLERTITDVLELDEHARSGSVYGGGWTAYRASGPPTRRTPSTTTPCTSHNAPNSAVARSASAGGRAAAWPGRRSARDNDKAQRDFRVNRTEALAGRARRTERALDTLDVVEKPWEAWDLRFSISEAARSGDVVVRLEDAVMVRGAFTLGPLTLDIAWAERVALIGPNGSGKTTLVEAVLGRLPLAAGTRRLGPSVVVGELVDLAPSQLTVTDAGSPVQLSALRLVASDSGSEHLVTLVFDRLDPAGAKRARTVAEKVLGVFPEKGFSFAVLQVNGRLRLLQSYTVDRRLVDAAIADATPALPPAPSADLSPAEKALTASIGSYSDALGNEHRAEGKLIFSALEQSQRIQEESHGNPSLAALQAIVLGDRLLTGRKFILYFSEGVGPEAKDKLQSIIGLANRAGDTICVLDANAQNPQVVSAQSAALASSILSGGNSFGLGNLPGSSSSTSPFGGPGTAQALAGVHNSSGFEFGDLDNRESPLAPLATGTGGIFVGSSGGFDHQLQQLHGDLTSWYQAEWMPPIKSYNGEFRPIDIHSLRKDVVIRARSGYFAVEPTEATGVRPFEMPLLNILAAPALPTDIVFRAGIMHLGELPDGNAAELTVQVPISQLAVREDSNTHISAVHAAIVASD